MKRRLQFQIPRDREGAALADFLARRFPFHSREEWVARIARVLVNGEPGTADRILSFGDRIEYESEGIEEPPVRMDVQVVFQDADVAVVDKPGNLPCHPGGRYFNHTLWAALRQRPGFESLTLVNRLDRETSGLMLVALNAKAAKRCRSQLAGGRMHKRYLALVEGEFPEQAQAFGFLAPEEPGAGPRRQRFRPAPLSARPPRGAPPAASGEEWAETRFRRLERCGPISVVEAWPATGRLHQIRVTLHAMGFPVVGDKLYGVDPTLFVRFCEGALTGGDRQRLRMDRQALHAAGLGFRHPASGRELRFDLPLPPDMAELVERHRNLKPETRDLEPEAR